MLQEIISDIHWFVKIAGVRPERIDLDSAKYDELSEELSAQHPKFDYRYFELIRNRWDRLSIEGVLVHETSETADYYRFVIDPMQLPQRPKVKSNYEGERIKELERVK